MRACIAAVCTILLCGGMESRAAEPTPSAGKPESARSMVVDLLREACRITLKQGPDQQYWTERVLLDIGRVQIRARDFEGAERSIRGSANEYGRNGEIVELAESLARDGKLEQAREVLRSLGEDHGSGQASLDDGVQLKWIEHLIATGALDRAGQAIPQLKTESSRAEGFVKIGSAYAESGDWVRAAANFGAAIDAADKVTDDFHRARAMWQTAGAQFAAGAAEAASVTIRKFAEQTEYKDSWAKVAALREAGALAFKMDDHDAARRLFRRAIDSSNKLDTENKIGALSVIAIAQARAGAFDSALQTAALIKHDDANRRRDGRREEAVYAATVAMLKADDVEGAVRTAFSITYYVGYRDDALQEIADFHIQKRDLAAALSAAEKISVSSTKAIEILKIAAEHAKSGDRRTAAEVASRIELTDRGFLNVGGKIQRFDYRSPPTWGVCYEPGFTMASIHSSNQQAASVAAAAMTLAHELGQKPSQPYEVSFKGFQEMAVRALARTHSRTGDSSDALAWARRIGSDGEVAAEDDFETLWQVERRIHALVGVAEGILDRTSDASAVPHE
jgi:tetratricopeptide (TPR) repeat protein